MLKRLTLDRELLKKWMDNCKDLIEQYGWIEQTFTGETNEDGIYVCDNFPKDLYLETKDMGYEDEFPHFDYDVTEGEDWVNSFGVADTPEQIKEYYKKQIEDPDNEYFISMFSVHQDKKGDSWGTWRWHKWGPYIGKFEPKHEYLNDEDFGPDFQGYVICFHIHRIPKKKN